MSGRSRTPPYPPAGRGGEGPQHTRRGRGLGAASSAPPPPHALLLPLRLRQLRRCTTPPSLPPGLLSAIHPLELACRDRFRKPVGVWKQLVRGAGGRLRAEESECPEEDKAENKGKPAPFPIFLFGLIFQKQFSGKFLFGSKRFLLFHLFQASIGGPNQSLGGQDQDSDPSASTSLLCNLVPVAHPLWASVSFSIKSEWKGLKLSHSEGPCFWDSISGVRQLDQMSPKPLYSSEILRFML